MVFTPEQTLDTVPQRATGNLTHFASAAAFREGGFKRQYPDVKVRSIAVYLLHCFKKNYVTLGLSLSALGLALQCHAKKRGRMSLYYPQEEPYMKNIM
jgi:hypothetical protein